MKNTFENFICKKTNMMLKTIMVQNLVLVLLVPTKDRLDRISIYHTHTSRSHLPAKRHVVVLSENSKTRFLFRSSLLSNAPPFVVLQAAVATLCRSKPSFLSFSRQLFWHFLKVFGHILLYFVQEL